MVCLDGVMILHIYEKLDLFNLSSILLLYSEELRAELIKIELSLYTKKLIILGQKELKLISKNEILGYTVQILISLNTEAKPKKH